MTAKRFTSQRTDDYNFSDVLDNGKWIGICHVDCEDDFVNKFNELAEEIEQLKSSDTITDLETEIMKLKQENEQLKSRCNDYDKALKTLQGLTDRKLKENEQLKKESYGNLDGLNYYQEQNGYLSSKISDLECENEQLKTTIQQLRTDNTKQKKLLNTTMKENEHIKQTIKDMINTERTELRKMTLRHLWRQIQ